MMSDSRAGRRTSGLQYISCGLLASAAVVALVLGQAAYAGSTGGTLPSGGNYVAGSGTIGTSGSGLVVDQSSQTGIINWNSFSIGRSNSVQFDNGSGATLNRVTGGNLSQIAGSLMATGSLYLINPQGIVVDGSGKVVTGGSFVASSRDVSDAAFQNGGALEFAGSSNGAVVNQGSITSTNGDAVLIGNTVGNSGSLSAPNGTAGMTAGNDVVLQKVGDQHLYVKAGSGSVSNSGTVEAASVELKAADGNVYALAGNNGGIIRATGTQTVDGHVWLTAGGKVSVAGTVSAVNADGSGGSVTVRGSDITVSGQIDASATAADKAGGNVSVVATNDNRVTGAIKAAGGKSGKGGFIETSGHMLSVGGASVDAGQGGQWLLDPYDLTVDATAASTIDSSLGAGTSVTLQTTASGASGPGNQNASGNGDIFIDSPLSWGTTATLTLSAYRNIDFNANVTVSGGGTLSMTTGTGTSGDYSFGLGPTGFAGSISFTGGSSSGASFAINGTPYTLLYSMSDVQNISASNTALAGNYALATSLDATSILSWTPIGTDGQDNIRNSGNGFTGVFAGLGNTISNLMVNTGSYNYAGLFGVSSGTIRDIGMVGGAVSGGQYAGGLVGWNGSGGTISNSYATGAVNSTNKYIGGLVGENDGTITNAYATGAVSGIFDVGGLVGYNYGGAISNAYATGAVNGDGEVGGLVGEIWDGTIDNTYATGAASGWSGSGDVGGLVGFNGFGTISNAYATGVVSASYRVGGLVGENAGTITNANATGAVSGESGGEYVGGLVGFNNDGAISNAYATGAVSDTGSQDVGGLVGYNATSSTITDVYATGAVSGSSNVGGLVGYNSVGTITQSYATGAVSGSGNVGGLVGWNYDTIKQSYWDTQSSSQSNGVGYGDASGTTGLTDAQMRNSSNFTGWTFGGLGSGDTWVMIGAGGTVNGTGGTTPMLLSEYSTTITNAHQLQLMELDLGATYTLANNIDGSSTAGGDVWDTSGFVPIGNGSSGFTGTFDGENHTISNLTINRPSTDYVGLFGALTGTIHDIGMVGGAVSGGQYVGGLAAWFNKGTISNSYATTAVSGMDDVGGLVGFSTGTINDSYAAGTVNGNSGVGGLVGLENTGTISNSYATGAVSGGTASYDVGGLVGAFSFGTISDSYATGVVRGGSGSYVIGGLVGDNQGTITNAYATGTVSGITSVGGLVGDNDTSGVISSAYATGAVSGTGNVGGLTGWNSNGTISNAYATGAVSGSGNVGGLVGNNSGGTISHGYWDTQTSGQSIGIGADDNNQIGNVTGNTTAQLQGVLPSSFDSSVWGTGSGLFPYFLWQYPTTPQAVSGIAYNNASVTPLASTASGAVTVSALVDGTSLGNTTTGANGYYYILVAPGMFSGTQQLLTYLNGDTVTANTYVQSPTGTVTNADLYGGYLRLLSGASTTSSMFNGLSTALGGNTGSDFLFTGSSLVTGTSLDIESSNNGGFSINSGLNLGTGSVILDAAGSISESGSGLITAASLTGSSAGATTLNAANQIGSLADFTSSGGLQLTDTESLTVSGAVTTSGGFQLTDAGSLTVNGAVNVTGCCAVLTTTGSGSNLTIDAAITNTDHTLQLYSAGTLTQNSAGILTAFSLTGSSAGATTLNAANQIGSLADFTSSGGLQLTDTESLTVSGAVNVTGCCAVLTTTGSGSNLAIDGALTGATVDLVSAGTIGQNSAGILTAGTLTGSSVGNTTLNVTNVIANLGSFTTDNGTLGLVDDATLTVNGAVDAGTGNVVIGTNGTGHNIVVDATLSGNVVGVVSSGAITVNSALTFPFQTTGIELSAVGVLNINAPITINNTGGVVLNAGYDTTTVPGKSLLELYFGALGNISFGTLDEGSEIEINGAQYTLIYSLADIQKYTTTSAYLSGNYALATSLDASSTTGWVPVGTNGSGSVLNSGAGFSGIFEGLGNAISNLTVNAGSSNYAGLFGYSSGTIRDLTLTGASVTGNEYVGGLAGFQSGVVANVAVTVPVTGSSILGGLIGYNTGAVVQSYATGSIAATGTVGGGLVGLNSGNLIDDYATGAVSASNQGGGLVGSNSGTIASVYSTGFVSGTNGGLIGAESGGTITDAYWDTQTSGTTSSAGGTGLTTSQLQGTLPPGFGNTVWGTDAGLFPYLLRQYPNGAPEIVSGTAYSSQGGTAAAGQTLTVLENGSTLASVTTDAYGNYSMLLAPGGDVVIFGAGTVGATVIEGVAGPVTGLPIYGNTLNQVTSDALYSSVNSATVRAIGANPVNGTNIGVVNTIDQLGTLRIDTSASSFTLDESINWTTIDLVAAGSISQSNGIITATTFMGSSNGAVTLPYESVTNLGGFTTNNGAFTFDVGSTVTGAVNTGTGSLTLISLGFSNVLTINAPLTGGTVTLTAAGSITQNIAGIITASTLTGSSGGDVPVESTTLTADNAITNLGAFVAEGGFTLHDTKALTVTGAVNAGSGNLTLTTAGSGSNLAIDGALTGATVDLASAGALGQNSAGILTASALTGSSAGATTLTDANQVAKLGNFSVSTGNLSFDDTQALDVTGNIQATASNATLSLTTTNGNLHVTGTGILSAATVSLNTAGEALEDASGQIDTNLINVTANTGIDLIGTANDIVAIGIDTTTSGPNVINR